ncbi:hypothetical protein [Yinghuangia seranimata]|uniref:hypothetical protein n=1 Tax=Yinghuangia seranimata TaxID=408067 RepID=UPI00248A9876|nr:hypothetical protein [Yinghuangia seranimata]MDI2127629.1 hypothetical protein [Yinghuangia seranimata]
MDDVIVRVVETCASHPSQWDAWTAEGHYLFLHYRLGIGTVEEHPDCDPRSWTNEAWETGRSRTVKEWNDDTNEGYMLLAEFLTAAGLRLAADADGSCR